MLVTYISSSGVRHEVDRDSVAAELMSKDSTFRLIGVDEKTERDSTESQPSKPPELPNGDFSSLTISSKLIRDLMAVKANKSWKAWGFRSFADFLNSDMVPFGSTKFYKLRDLLNAKGDKAFDLLFSN